MKFFSVSVFVFMYLGFAMAGSSPLRGGDQRDLAKSKKVNVCAKTGEGVYVTQTVAKWIPASMAAYAVLGTCSSLCKTLCAEKFNSFTASETKCTCTKPKLEPVVICVKAGERYYETQTIPEWTDENTQNGDIRSDCASICEGLCTQTGYKHRVTMNGNCDCFLEPTIHGPL